MSRSTPRCFCLTAHQEVQIGKGVALMMSVPTPKGVRDRRSLLLEEEITLRTKRKDWASSLLTRSWDWGLQDGIPIGCKVHEPDRS